MSQKLQIRVRIQTNASIAVKIQQTFNNFLDQKTQPITPPLVLSNNTSMNPEPSHLTFAYVVLHPVVYSNTRRRQQ